MLSPLLGQRVGPRPTAALGCLVAALGFLSDPDPSFLRPEQQVGWQRGMALWGPARETPQCVSFFAASSCLEVHRLGCRYHEPRVPEQGLCKVGESSVHMEQP